jgi:Ca2+-binding EF-hand superfamily protein
MTKTVLAVSTAVIVALGLAGAASAKGHKHGAERMFQHMDLNSDGKITKDEMQQAKAARFTQTDTNGDGFLSAEEMTAQAKKMDSEKRARRVAKMIEKLDTDKDGKLSAEEAAKRGPDAERMARMFDRLDANKDGAITMEEAKAGKGKKWKHGQKKGE